MSYKSRGNWASGICLPTCKCPNCRGNKKPWPQMKSSKSVNTITGIVVNTRYAPDGSRLEKPMSQSYINHIRSRNSDSIKKMKPNMGAYGA